MLGQIRLYTINKGAMDDFLKVFQEVVIPLHERVGLPILATWVNRSQNEFIWVRGFENAEDRERKLKAFRESPQMADIHNRVATNIAKMEVREVEAHSRRWEPGSNSDLIRSQRLRMEKLCQA